MTSTRIEPSKASTLFTVGVQANWNGVDITDANGGVFNAPLQWAGSILLVQWIFRFANLASSGTAGTLQLKVPELSWLPDQYCGTFTVRGATVPVSAPARFGTPGPVFEALGFTAFTGRSTSLTAQLSAQILNY